MVGGFFRPSFFSSQLPIRMGAEMPATMQNGTAKHMNNVPMVYSFPFGMWLACDDWDGLEMKGLVFE